MSSEFIESIIDHKDEPGEHRKAVFKYVRSQIGNDGYTPNKFSEFCGTWIGDLVPASGQTAGGTLRKKITINPDGLAPSKSLESDWECPKDKWQLNENGSLSQWSYVEPMPEYGIDEPTYEEECLHVLFISKDVFVTFNGDASLVFRYTRVKNET